MANYVEPEDFYKDICDYLESLKRNPEARISNSLAIKIERTIRGMANMHCFKNYPFKEDMIGDAIYYALKYLKNYDITRKNVHAYISTIAYRSFLQRIATERKHLYTKYKIQLKSDSIMNLVNTDNHQILKGGVGDFQNLESFVDDFEKTIEKKRIAKLKK